MSQTIAKFGQLLSGPVCVASIMLSIVFGQPQQYASAEDPIPSWTNSDDKVIQAEFVMLDSEKLVIRKDGSSFGIPFDALSRESQKQALKFSTENSIKLQRQVPSLLSKLATQEQYVAMTHDTLAAKQDLRSKIRASRAITEQEEAELQADAQKLRQSFEKIDLESRRLRILIASSLLRSESSGLKPELVGRIDNITKQMTELQEIEGTPAPQQVRRAETLHTVARLRLSSAHLRSLGIADSAARIEAEAVALERTIKVEER